MNSRFRRTCSVIFGLALIGTLFPPFSGTTAATESSARGKLQGTWELQINPYICATGTPLPSFSALVSFARGGTLTEVVNTGAFLPGQVTPGLGVWSHTRDKLYRADWEVFILFDTPSTVPGFPFKRGVQRLTREIEVFGDQMIFDGSGELLDTNGILLAVTCANGVGTRLQSSP
ncbi:MAG TPA: hypothetical protein VLB07_13440 [Woeseiaceae bacterium]|nr:hypothetical protein [Woeseiaceae bacterium]